MQSWWQDKCNTVAHAKLMASLTGREACRLSEEASPIACGWMAARPSITQGTKMDGPEYRTLLKWSLGVPPYPGNVGRESEPSELRGDGRRSRRSYGVLP